ncbi:MAG: formate dehydrogenase accessory sulfurtransferase FdhD, partial [Lachnospiraceae bacterium]|nr:formate dehydrogenase accessory sulfurtransferase FdhD [Lachnospiraceae bacterium]
MPETEKTTEKQNDPTDRRDSILICRDGNKLTREETLLREHELTVIVNDKPVMKLVCTRDSLYELVLGRLKTEGFIDKAEDIYRIYFCRYENEATVLLNKEIPL